MPHDFKPKISAALPEGLPASASSALQPPSVEQMGAVLPQYEVLEILGRGAWAQFTTRTRSR